MIVSFSYLQHISNLPQDFFMSHSIYIYNSWVRDTWHPDLICAMVLFFHTDYSLGLHLVATVVSFTDLRTNGILNWSFLHSSFQVNFRCGRPHFIQVLCFPSSVAFAFLWSSSVLFTSAWTKVCISVACVLDHCMNCDICTPCRPVLVLLTMSRKWRIISLWSTDVISDRFLPVLV